MTTEEITKIMDESVGKLTDYQCRIIIHYMMGYLRYASDVNFARETFFTQIKAATEKKSLPQL